MSNLLSRPTYVHQSRDFDWCVAQDNFTAKHRRLIDRARGQEANPPLTHILKPSRNFCGLRLARAELRQRPEFNLHALRETSVLASIKSRRGFHDKDNQPWKVIRKLCRWASPRCVTRIAPWPQGYSRLRRHYFAYDARSGGDRHFHHHKP
jgi:hypothetical protein